MSHSGNDPLPGRVSHAARNKNMSRAKSAPMSQERFDPSPGVSRFSSTFTDALAPHWNRIEKSYPRVAALLSSRRTQVVFAVCAALLIASAAFTPLFVGKGNAAADAEPDRQPRIVDGKFYPSPAQRAALQLQQVQREKLPVEFTTEGKITIDEDRATAIFSPYAGRVLSLLAAPGDEVKKGQPLFVLEAADSVQVQNDFISALTTLNKAKSALYLAETLDRRMTTLFNNNIAPLKDLQSAQAGLTTAQNDVRTAQTALQAMRNRLYILGKTEAEVDKFEETGTITPDSTVYAPLSGTILQRKTGPGQFISTNSSDPVFTIGDISSVWLVAYVRESDAPKVRLGQSIKFTVLAYPNRQFEAKINYVAKMLDPASRRLTVRATIDNAEDVLNPEMFASVTIAAHEGEALPTVPVESIIYEGEQTRLWVMLDDGAVVPRPVKLGAANGRYIQVLSGLEAGERIVTRGGLFIDRMIASR